MQKRNDLFSLAFVPRFRDKELIEKVAIKVKKLREARGLSQQEAYNDTGINFGRIEATPQDISLSTISVLCKYFDLTLSEFLKGM